jgi:hypothetical protein
MADPFGDQGKRPAPTIEGTATEIKADAETSAAARDAAAAEANEPERAAADPDNRKAAGEAGAGHVPPQPVRSGNSVRNALLSLFAGLIGGALAALALPYVWKDGASVQPADTSALAARVAKLEAAPPPDTTQNERIARLEDSLKTMAEAAKQDGSVADAAAVSQQISEAEQRFQEKLDEALRGVEPVDAEQIQTVRKELADLRSRVSALREAATDDNAAAAPEIMALGERILALESTVPNLVGAIDKEMAGTRSAALTLAFSNLRAAVNAGKPYVAELKTITALAPGAGELGKLPDYAETGVPTLPELTRQFREKKDAALTVASPSEEQSFLGELMTSAQSLVKVRRVDDSPEGNSVTAILTRADTDLESEQLPDAVAEVETLQGEAREPFAAWLEAARARIAAEETLQRLEGVLLASLTGGAPAQP